MSPQPARERLWKRLVERAPRQALGTCSLALEIWGFLNLFGSFFPIALAFLKQLPFLNDTALGYVPMMLDARQYHDYISFLGYSVAFVGTVLTLKEGHYKAQVSQSVSQSVKQISMHCLTHSLT